MAKDLSTLAAAAEEEKARLREEKKQFKQEQRAQKKEAKRIPVIAMTANAFAEDEKEALKAGMNAHVAKPLDVEMLKKVIGQYIKRAGEV